MRLCCPCETRNLTQPVRELEVRDKAEVLDQAMEGLEPLGDVTSRAMFGGFGIYEGGKMFALIGNAELYFKVDDSTRPAFEEAGSEPFGKMPYFLVPPEVVESAERLQEWARAAIAVGHATGKRRRRSSRG